MFFLGSFDEKQMAWMVSMGFTPSVCPGKPIYLEERRESGKSEEHRVEDGKRGGGKPEPFKGWHKGLGLSKP